MLPRDRWWPEPERAREMHEFPVSPQQLAMPTFRYSSEIEAPARAVFAWHRTPGALAALIPPWERVAVERAPRDLQVGERAVLRIGRPPLRLRWVAEHVAFADRGELGGEFTDRQVSGPFRRWVHRHSVTAAGPRACVLEDHVDYELPFGRAGAWLAGSIVTARLERMFAFRHAATRSAVAAAGRPA